jgi:ABC-type multidrug transport system permease subunit
MENKEMNFNYSECIKEQNNIGETTYYNICNNETYKIIWGSDTWVGVIMLFIIFVLVIIALIKGIFEF